MKKILLTTLGLCVIGIPVACVSQSQFKEQKPTPIKWEYSGRVKKVDYKVTMFEKFTIVETESTIITVPMLISNIKFNKKFYLGSRGDDRYIYQESDEKSIQINR